MTVTLTQKQLYDIVHNALHDMCTGMGGNAAYCSKQADSAVGVFENLAREKLSGPRGNYIFTATPEEINKMAEDTAKRICKDINAKANCSPSQKKVVEQVRRAVSPTRPSSPPNAAYMQARKGNDVAALLNSVPSTQTPLPRAMSPSQAPMRSPPVRVDRMRQRNLTDSVRPGDSLSMAVHKMYR